MPLSWLKLTPFLLFPQQVPSFGGWEGDVHPRHYPLPHSPCSTGWHHPPIGGRQPDNSQAPGRSSRCPPHIRTQTSSSMWRWMVAFVIHSQGRRGPRSQAVFFLPNSLGMRLGRGRHKDSRQNTHSSCCFTYRWRVIAFQRHFPACSPLS